MKITDLLSETQLSELSKDTLSNYNDKADMDIVKKHRNRSGQVGADDKAAVAKTDKHIDKRMKGIDSASSRLNKNVAEMRSRRDAYERDYDSSVSGMGRGHDHRGLGQELAHETNNIAIAINGKTWKVVPGRGYADSKEEWSYLNNMKNWAEKKSASTGKKWSVHLTGASLTETATAGSTSAGNVSVGAVYSNKPPKQPKNKDGTAKNAVDMKGVNLLTGGSIKR